MDIQAVRKLAEREEVDYTFLLSVLKEYTSPRDKVTTWLRAGDLIRVKKGLYIFGKHVAVHPYSQEVLANLIYGPSAISLTYALSFYGLIPERVTTVTCITNKRNKLFQTPVGEFTYHYLNSNKYPVGIQLIKHIEGAHFLMASPEKALCDHIHLTDKHLMLDSESDIESYLFHDMRIDETLLKKFKINSLLEINRYYLDVRLTQLIHFIKKWKLHYA